MRLQSVACPPPPSPALRSCRRWDEGSRCYTRDSGSGGSGGLEKAKFCGPGVLSGACSFLHRGSPLAVRPLPEECHLQPGLDHKHSFLTGVKLQNLVTKAELGVSAEHSTSQVEEELWVGVLKVGL